ncbi:MAG: M48 family metallopeptidase [Acidobacteriota bacterium]
MNLYATIILTTLLVDYLLGLVADVLNLRASTNEPPADVAGIYEASAYAKSQRYTRDSTQFGLVASSVDLAALLIFWFLGGFNHLDLWLRDFDLHPLLTGLLYIGILGLAKAALDLPFRIYSTFVIEERYGFNRTTPKTFVTDLLKGLALALILGGPILALVLTLFDRAGAGAWLFCWLGFALFTLALQIVLPIWILPLFLDFSPLEEGELRTKLSEYARSVGFALQGIFVIDGSRRSSRANAFFTGIGANKRIALFDTLIEKHSAQELVAVLAHEVGHYKKRHIVKTLALAIAHSGVMFYLLSLFLSHQGLFEAFGMERTSTYTGLVFFGLLYAPVELLLSMVLNVQLRRHEFEADRFAVETIDEPQAMASALEKLAADNLSNLTPHPFYVFLNYSHPPLRERLAAIRAV